MNNCDKEKMKGSLLEASRCLQCYDAPCNKGCPAGVEVEKFIRLISKGDFVGAAQTIEKDNPFGLICGMLCPHESLCQKGCTSHKLGRPIDIKTLQRYALENVRQESIGNSAVSRDDIPVQRLNIEGNIEYAKASLVKQNNKVAVIGAGPSGLTCALYLTQLGYQVEIFEQTEMVGGRLTQGIPNFRIDRDMLIVELKDMVASLTIHFNKMLGNDITFAELKDLGFNTIYLACGKWQEKKLDIAGCQLDGVYTSTDILCGDRWKGKMHKKAAVIGAGNVAMDVARTLLAQGLEEVNVFFIGSNKEVSAWQNEREEAWQEGVIFHMLAAPEKLVGKEGRISAIKFNRSKVLNEENGTWSIKALEDDLDFIYPIDMVVTSIGFDTMRDVLSGQGIHLNPSGHVTVDYSLATNIPGVFAGGDLIESNSYTVVRAVADGKRAALNIHKMLQRGRC